MTLNRLFFRLLLPPLLGLVAITAIALFWILSCQMRTAFDRELQAVAVGLTGTLGKGSPDTVEMTLPADLIDPSVYLIKEDEEGSIVPKVLKGKADPEVIVDLEDHLSSFQKRGLERVIWRSNGRAIALAPLSRTEWVAVEASGEGLSARRKGLVGILVMCATIATGVIILTARAAVRRLSEPLGKLKNAALAAAAGGYTTDIPAEGGREIVDLANAFNTMRAGLQENISTIRESSVLRELMYGEYECALLLQHYMLDKTLESFESPLCQLRAISVRSAAVPVGLSLQLNTEPNGDLLIRLAEAPQPGLQGIIDLLSGPEEDLPTVAIRMTADAGKIQLRSETLSLPLVWSTAQGAFVQPREGVWPIAQGDYVFLFNSAFADVIEHSALLHEWFGKVMNHFSQDGLDGVVPMLTSELDFLEKTLHIDRDLYLLCGRVRIWDSDLPDWRE